MEELHRNLIIAMGCVFVTTFVLIANLFACLLVLFCVVLTLVSVAHSSFSKGSHGSSLLFKGLREWDDALLGPYHRYCFVH